MLKNPILMAYKKVWKRAEKFNIYKYWKMFQTIKSINKIMLNTLLIKLIEITTFVSIAIISHLICKLLDKFLDY
jgi:hypothetical protein